MISLPLTAIWAVIHGVQGVSEAAFTAGMILMGLWPLAAPRLAPVFGGIISGMSRRDEQDGRADDPEDDILNNRTKWRLIVAGYVFFIIFAIFSVVAILRLNAKVNTLYEHSKDMDQRIEEMAGK